MTSLLTIASFSESGPGERAQEKCDGGMVNEEDITNMISLVEIVWFVSSLLCAASGCSCVTIMIFTTLTLLLFHMFHYCPMHSTIVVCTPLSSADFLLLRLYYSSATIVKNFNYVLFKSPIVPVYCSIITTPCSPLFTLYIVHLKSIVPWCSNKEDNDLSVLVYKALG